MAPLIRAVLSKHIGDEEAKEIEIISNDVEILPDGKWRIKYRHPSRYAGWYADDLAVYPLLPIADMATTSPGQSCHTKNFPTHQLCSSSETVYQVCVLRSLLLPGTGRLRMMVKSDISAAEHADVLFVKQKDDGENDLATYCKRLGIQHLLFPDFSKALPIVRSVVKGEKWVEELLCIGKA